MANKKKKPEVITEIKEPIVLSNGYVMVEFINSKFVKSGTIKQLTKQHAETLVKKGSAQYKTK